MSELADLEMPVWLAQTPDGVTRRLLCFKTDVHTFDAGKICRCPLDSTGVLVSDLLRGDNPDCPDPDAYWNSGR